LIPNEVVGMNLSVLLSSMEDSRFANVTVELSLLFSVHQHVDGELADDWEIPLIFPEAESVTH